MTFQKAKGEWWVGNSFRGDGALVGVSSCHWWARWVEVVVKMVLEVSFSGASLTKSVFCQASP